MISVVLSLYARPNNLDLQINALLSKTIKLDAIIIVVDKNINVEFDESYTGLIHVTNGKPIS